MALGAFAPPRGSRGLREDPTVGMGEALLGRVAVGLSVSAVYGPLVADERQGRNGKQEALGVGGEK